MKTGRPRTKWTRSTVAIRVPAIFAKGLENLAHQWDQSGDAGPYYLEGDDISGFVIKCRRREWLNPPPDDLEFCRGDSLAAMSVVLDALNATEIGIAE